LLRSVNYAFARSWNRDSIGRVCDNVARRILVIDDKLDAGLVGRAWAVGIGREFEIMEDMAVGSAKLTESRRQKAAPRRAPIGSRRCISFQARFFLPAASVKR
jgi:hypothetical protein